LNTATTSELTDSVDDVRSFWNTEACGTHFIRSFTDDRDFFSQYRAFRYRTEWHIPTFAQFAAASGKDVLEIGCGNGVDGLMFARHGARYTGVDLTTEAVDATRRHFATEGASGTLRQENCERLSFADDTFDVVYSFGVLHHTPDPGQAVREVHRVLRPGGIARVMLYHRHSFNYYVRILTAMRARALLEVMRRAASWRVDRSKAAMTAMHGVRGNDSRRVWEIHYRNFLARGWSYFKARNFVHHCTDGPECPYAFTYSAKDARELFGQFRSVETSVGHFPLNKYFAGHFMPRAVEALLARSIGWHLLIRATK
jgi:2-polyprenyl-3-methyl-5-hydroxy-6-metoxy-1,4-benzoquinol methylase